jgi:hypothetical protein
MSSMKQLVRFQFAVWLFSGTAFGLAAFTNPSGSDGSLTLTIWDQHIVEWQNAQFDYSELSLGVLAQADGNIFWLLCKTLVWDKIGLRLPIFQQM